MRSRSVAAGRICSVVRRRRSDFALRVSGQLMRLSAYRPEQNILLRCGEHVAVMRWISQYVGRVSRALVSASMMASWNFGRTCLIA